MIHWVRLNQGSDLVSNKAEYSYLESDLPSFSASMAASIEGQPDYVSALVSGYQWNTTVGAPITVTYSFLTAVPDYYPADAEERNNFIPLDEAQKEGARRALQLWSEIANIQFVEVADTGGGGQMRFGTAQLSPSAAAHAYYPDIDTGGDVWLNNFFPGNLDQSDGSYGFLTMLHEIGHALGLKHPGNYNAGSDGGEPPFLTENDNYQYTVMSYNDHPEAMGYPLSPMLYDIAALQYLYGVRWTTRSGDDIYSWATNASFIQTIWDGGGIDLIDASNQVRSVVIDLSAGAFSSIGANPSNTGDARFNVAIAFGVTIEDANGGIGDDTLYGNGASNVLQGGAGNDYLVGGDGYSSIGTGHDLLDGGFGADTLDGGDGDDTYVVDSYFDSIIEFADTGNETVIASLDWSLAGTPLNNLVLAEPAFEGIGNDLPNWLIGNDSANSLTGGDGNDTLVGNGGNDVLNGYGILNSSLVGAQIDTLVGAAGTDYFVLGGFWGVSYIEEGSGYAIIQDWNVAEDWIYAAGGNNTYRIQRSSNILGESALDAEIYHVGSGDRIAIVQDNTNISLSDFIYT